MDNTELMSHVTIIAEQARILVETQYPNAEITSIDLDAMVHYRLRGPNDTDPVAGKIAFYVKAVEAPTLPVPMEQYRVKRHTFRVEQFPHGLQITKVTTMS